MMHVKIQYIEDSVRITPDNNYVIRIQDGDEYIYADGFVQIPIEFYDESKIDVILIEDIPFENLDLETKE